MFRGQGSTSGSCRSRSIVPGCSDSISGSCLIHFPSSSLCSQISAPLCKWFPLMAQCPSTNLFLSTLRPFCPIPFRWKERLCLSSFKPCSTFSDLCAVNYGGSNPAARKAPDCSPHPGVETQHWLLRPLWDFPLVFALAGGDIDLFLLRRM